MYVKEVRQKLDKVSIEKSSMKKNHVKKNRESSETSKSYSKTITTNDVPKRIDGWGVQFNWPYYLNIARNGSKFISEF